MYTLLNSYKFIFLDYLVKRVQIQKIIDINHPVFTRVCIVPTPLFFANNCIIRGIIFSAFYQCVLWLHDHEFSSKYDIASFC